MERTYHFIINGATIARENGHPVELRALDTERELIRRLIPTQGQEAVITMTLQWTNSTNHKVTPAEMATSIDAVQEWLHQYRAGNRTHINHILNSRSDRLKMALAATAADLGAVIMLAQIMTIISVDIQSGRASQELKRLTDNFWLEL